ncbi:hypothetical protein ACHMW6_06095 [Pseudoduganella sp. UC29_106]|uniref:hypothetical protein n=1 Tax=Pseudoduganella sp. UC29_106 TaxID=3374553 RepID=UPI003756ED82
MMTTREALMQRIEQTFDANCGKHPEHVAKRLEDICWQVDQWAREDERQAQAARISGLIDLLWCAIRVVKKTDEAEAERIATGARRTLAAVLPASPVSKQG